MLYELDKARVRRALESLCALAGVAPADGSPEAGEAVRAALDAAGITGERSSPTDCPVSNWLRREAHLVPPEAGGPRVYVAPGCVLLRDPIGPDMPCGLEQLPAAVRSAVRQGDALVPARSPKSDRQAVAAEAA